MRQLLLHVPGAASMNGMKKRNRHQQQACAGKPGVTALRQHLGRIQHICNQPILCCGVCHAGWIHVQGAGGVCALLLPANQGKHVLHRELAASVAVRRGSCAVLLVCSAPGLLLSAARHCCRQSTPHSITLLFISMLLHRTTWRWRWTAGCAASLRAA